MRTWTFVATALLLGLVAAPLATPTVAAASVRLVVFGDTGVTPSTQSNVDGALREGATGYVGLGDYYYWSAPSAWKDMFRPLTKGGAHLALGNHDDRAVLAEYFPDGPTWSRVVNGVRLVAVDTEARMDVGSVQHTFVRGQLCGAAEPVRVIVAHKNWWLGSGARHPGSEWPGSASAMDALVRDCGVDLVLVGHEHNYQRLVRNGVPHVIVGTGGQSEYAVAGSPSGTAATYVGHGRLLLDLSSDGFRAEFRSLDGTVRDAFTYGAPAPAPAPAPSGGASFTRSTGNEWWVQVKASYAGGVRAVEARDAGGAWVGLTLRSWGDWAGSFHVEPGHWVQYRATLGDGRVAESCLFTHPQGTCQSAFSATFRNVRGNVWWVETDVSASGGTLAAVDARVDGGAWVALSKTSWGSWAKSMKAPAGSKVELRARAADGATSVSGPYAWPP